MIISDESSLLARCRQGETQAWDELFDLHYLPAGRFVAQLSHEFTREDVEEICQEVFLTVIKQLATFHGQSRFQTWLFRVAANKARDYLASRRAAKRGGGQRVVPLHTNGSRAEEGHYAQDTPHPGPSPDLALMQAEQAGLIGAALAELGDPCQEIIELRYFADLSYEEIAQNLTLNPKTVSSRLSKCLDKLEVVARGVFAREKKSSASV